MAYDTGIMTADCCLYHFIKTRGGYTQIAHVSYFECRLKDRFDMVASFCRCEDDRGVRNELEPFGNDLGIGFCAFNLIVRMWKLASTFGTTLFLCKVPFVDNHNDTFAHLMNCAGDMSVLCSQTFAGINEQQSHIAAFDSAIRAQDTVFFNARSNAATAANASSIDQSQFVLFELEFSVNSVTCGAGDIADNCALCTQDSIKQRGFANVRTSHDSNAWNTFLFFLFHFFGRRQSFDDAIQQIA